jgi:hypothetical protein
MSNDSARQASVRAVAGTAYDYNADWHALFDSAAVSAGTFSERMLAYINTSLGASHTNVNSAMQAYAESQGAYNWSSMGTFTPGGVAPDRSILDRAGSYILDRSGAYIITRA